MPIARLPTSRRLHASRSLIFPNESLAMRIERAESRLVADGVSPSLRAEDRAFVREICGGVAAYSFPGSPFNKVAGLGFAGPLDAAALASVESEYRARRAPVCVEIATLADPATVRAFSNRGYRVMGFEDVLGLTLRSTDVFPTTEIEIRRDEDDANLDSWCERMVEAFSVADSQGVASHESFDRLTLLRAIRDAANNDATHRFLARLDGANAALASLGIRDGIAQLCGSATLPRFRRRGLQTALLHARLAHASAAGCDLAVVTTLPGSKSQENAMRAGFQRLYTRVILVLE